MRKEVKALLGAFALGGAVWLAWPPVGDRAHGRIPCEGYVWQRHWGPEVRDAVACGAQELDGLVALAAEVSFERGRPRVARAPLDYGLLASAGVPVGLALRVGPHPGPFERADEVTELLAGLAREMVAAARRGGLEPAELQIDFDCASSKLRGYGIWVDEIGKAAAPVHVTVTVLPSWLGHDGFRELVGACPGFVLQVHSLEPPRSPDDTLLLADPDRARRWVERASGYGVPFRVALPTYGYVVGFRPDGTFLGLQAEGEAPAWPEGAIVKESRADPDAMAALVRQWTEDRPATLEGLIWYRLPVATDTLNWSWGAFSAVLEGRSPRTSLRAAARRVEPCLYEVLLSNDGERDLRSGTAVSVQWSGARLVAGEAFGDVEWIDGGAGSVVLRSGTRVPTWSVLAGEERTLGWLRMSGEVELDVQVVAKDS